MSLLVEDPKEEDYPALVALVFEAYGGKNEYINAVFPNNTTEEGLEKAVQRCLYMTKMSKAVKWHKVTDTATGEIIGGTMWSICTDAKPPNSELDGPPGTWQSEDAKEYAQALFRGCKEYERKYWEDNDLPLMSLIMMAVKPEHQFRGAGTLLMKEGLQIADSLGAACTVESTDAGRWLYEQNGFVVQCHHILPVPMKFASRPKVRHFFMVRGRKTADGARAD